MHARALGLIREFVTDAAKGPLMQFLIVERANIQVSADRANISDHQPLHPFTSQRADKFAGEFVLYILDLVLHFSQLFPLAMSEFFASPGAGLFSGDTAS